MFYQIAADIVVLLHLLWIVFLIFGAFIGRRYRWVKRVHIPGIIFAVTIQYFGWYCPLTHLEIWLRRMNDTMPDYAGSFIMYYVNKIVYIELPADVIMKLTIVLVIVSALVYLYKPMKNKGQSGNNI